MGKIIGYGATGVMLALALAGIWEYFFVHKGSKRRIITLAIFAIASLIVLANQYETDQQHEGDVGEIRALKDAVNKANSTQQTNAREFSKAQETARTQFLAQFGAMSTRVADLQTDIKTANLKQEAEQLRSELQSTQKALVKPKARLAMSFGVPTDIPARFTEERSINNIVHVMVTLVNMTTTPAAQITLTLFVCDECRFQTEPLGFSKDEAYPDRARVALIPQLAGKTRSSKIEFDMKTPGPGRYRIIMAYRCADCEIPQKDINGDAPEEITGLMEVK
jgi:hypothetical protein